VLSLTTNQTLPQSESLSKMCQKMIDNAVGEVYLMLFAWEIDKNCVVVYYKWLLEEDLLIRMTRL